MNLWFRGIPPKNGWIKVEGVRGMMAVRELLGGHYECIVGENLDLN